MLAVVLTYLLAIALTEIVTEVLVDSVLLERLRTKIGGDAESPVGLRGILIRCGYCVSFWVAWGWAAVLRLKLGLGWPEPWLEVVVAGLLVQRGSNVWHDVLGWLRHRVHPRG